MSRSAPRRIHRLDCDRLEARWLLAAEIVGNAGEVVSSQFQPYGFGAPVGSQLEDVLIRGPFTIDLATPATSGGPAPAKVMNSGLVDQSQFNGGGFHTVGLQFSGVRLGGGFTVTGSDNENAGLPPTTPVLPALPNRNVISNSQLNDGGFGTLEASPSGILTTREGRVGLQWRNTRVRGPVDIGVNVDVVQPGAAGSATPPAGLRVAAATAPVPAAVSSPAGTVIDFSTNSGHIINSQVNDGGFGDIGLQWSHVGVGGRVGTSTNSLLIKPQQDNYGPITIKNRVFDPTGSVGGLHANGSRPISAPTVPPAALATTSTPPFRTTYTNSATNSGQILNSQFNDGGFGDIGLQWRNVRVGGNVTAVHNSLTVQPQNKGQGLITVQDVKFPSVPAGSPRPAPSPFHVLPPDPPLVAHDGGPITQPLPTPTGPLSPYFPTPFAGTGTVALPFPGDFPLVNAASNSGLIQSAQFNGGGFGDLGLQWQNVRVGGNVSAVHNSLSVHPEGSGLQGITVSDVAYGPPVTPGIARRLAVLPYAVISPGSDTTAAAPKPVGQGLNPPNSRFLTNQQLAVANGNDVFLQWNGIEHRRGLVIVHNIIDITGVGPQTGPITLSNIRFPYKIPPIGVLGTSSRISGLATPSGRRASSARASLPSTPLLNTASNSGVIRHAQFIDAKVGDGVQQGDVATQWNNVAVLGSVNVVHNTLAVNASADLPPGDVSGPITISNITFNSGALGGDLSSKHNQIVVSPPDFFQRASTHKVNRGRALPQNPAVVNETNNSGVLNGGQLAAAGANHAFLQWQCVKIDGKVRVIDNVLSISVLDRPSAPINISNVTFA